MVLHKVITSGQLSINFYLTGNTIREEITITAPFLLNPVP